MQREVRRKTVDEIRSRVEQQATVSVKSFDRGGSLRRKRMARRLLGQLREKDWRSVMTQVAFEEIWKGRVEVKDQVRGEKEKVSERLR